MSRIKFKYVRLLGGLGNNLFQLALGYNIKMKLNSEIKLFRTSNINVHQNREKSWDFRQNDMDIKGFVQKLGVFHSYNSRMFTNRINESWFTPGSRIGNLLKFENLKTSTVENDPCWIPTIHDLHKYDVFAGYFQNAQLVLGLPESFFNVLNDYLETQGDKRFIQQTKDYEVCIQVRRGDYFHHKDTIGMLNENYFMKALENFGLSRSRAKALILTDEPEACEFLAKALPQSRIYGPDETDTLTTLMIMATSDNLVISNSSLAWWGGLLAKRSGAKVVAPSPWKIRSCTNHDASILFEGLGFTMVEAEFIG